MTDFLLQVLRETWEISKEAGIFLLFGFLLAGVLAVLVPKGLFTRLLGAGKVKSVLWASAIGIPLPLCSCGVLPTAIALRRQGATKGATVAFLVATPETGIDSIALSYALTDPILTVVRPLAGVATAIVAGLASNLFGAPRSRAALDAADAHAHAADFLEPTAPAAGDDRGYDDSGHDAHMHGHDHDHDHSAAGHLTALALRSRADFGRAGIRIARYAFGELLDETSYWLALGILLSAVVAAALPPVLIERYLGGGLVSMLAMLLLSISVYTCASSSTPLAAALVMKGLSPGAALVFLLAGPATNLGSVVVLLKFLGGRVVAVYLVAVVGMTLLAGYATDLVYRWSGLNARATFGTAGDFVPEPLKIAGAVALLALLAVSIWRTHVPREWIWLRDRVAAASGLGIDAPRLGWAALATVAVLWLGSGTFQVGPGEVALKERFGRVVGPPLGPGLHVRLPWPFESDRVVRKSEVRRMEFGFMRPQPSRAELTRAMTGNIASYGGNAAPDAMRASGVWFQSDASGEDSYLLTGDVNLIDLRSTVQYGIANPRAYAYGVADAEALMRSTALAALREVIATHGIDAIYTTAREEVEREVAGQMQARLDRYGSGMEVVSVRLLYVHPPDAVHNAFRDVASAQEDKLRTVNRANIFAVEKVNQAKADAAAMLEQALAAKDQDITHAKGDAAAFALRLGAFRTAPELTRFRLQLETLGAVLPGVQKIVRPGAGEVKDFDLWLLQPPAAAAGR